MFYKPSSFLISSASFFFRSFTSFFSSLNFRSSDFPFFTVPGPTQAATRAVLSTLAGGFDFGSLAKCECLYQKNYESNIINYTTLLVSPRCSGTRCGMRIPRPNTMQIPCDVDLGQVNFTIASVASSQISYTLLRRSPSLAFVIYDTNVHKNT